MRKILFLLLSTPLVLYADEKNSCLTSIDIFDSSNKQLISEIEKTITPLNNCNTYPRVINVTDIESVTGVQKRYRVERKYNGKMTEYTAKLNLHLIAFNSKIKNKSIEDIKFCVEKFGDKLYRTKTESLNLQVEFDQPSTEHVAPLLNIIISPLKDHRPTSDVYSMPMDMDCSTVMHELLHQLGLVDEYEEKLKIPKDRSWDNYGREVNKAYNCRIRGPETSAMSGQGIFYRLSGNKPFCCAFEKFSQQEIINETAYDYQINSAFMKAIEPHCEFIKRYHLLDNEINWGSSSNFISHHTRDLLHTHSLTFRIPAKGGEHFSEGEAYNEFSCRCTDIQCKKIRDTYDEYKKNKQLYSDKKICSNSFINFEDEPDPAVSCVPNPQRNEPVPSILLPAQFRSIINGNCNSPEVVIYNHCAKFAYQTGNCSPHDEWVRCKEREGQAWLK
ncbi:MAG: hypothetical protein KBD63_02970 [Bacteriovoracaceae bacterium]|nr:hypothetical protein [Bacteriovoracaceae bacterium]